MKVLKLVCTFSRDEKSGKIKYNIDSKSEGIAEDEVKEISEGCIRKIEEDEAKVCSSWFYFYRLPDGKYLMYSLRAEEEKYILAAIIFDGYLPYYPVQLYDSEIFTENSDRVVGGLFSRGLSSRLKPLDKIDFQHASAFIKNRNDRALEYLFDFIMDDEPMGDRSQQISIHDEKSAVKDEEDPEKRGNSIQIRDMAENIINWMTAVTMAFPLENAHNISFGLEVFKNGTAACALTTRELSTDSLDREPRVFDFISGRIPKTSNQFRFSRLVEMGYMISLETLSAFHRFLEKFSYKRADGEVEVCYKLFNILNFGLGNVKVEDVESALEFALKYGVQGVLEEIFEKLEGMLVNIEYEINFGTVYEISQFMFKTAAGSRERIYINKASDFYFTFTDRAIMKDEELDGEELLEFYKNIKNMTSKHADIIIKWGISPARFKRITEYVSEGTFSYQSDIFLKMIISDLTGMKYSWNRASHIEGFNELIDICCTCLSRGTVINCSLLESVGSDVDYFSHLSLSIYSKLTAGSTRDVFVKCFLECMDKQSASWAWEIRDTLYELDEKTRLLFDEFAYNISEKENKRELFWNYFKAGQKGMPKYVRSFSEEAMKLYVSLLGEEETGSECSRLIKFIVEYDFEVDDSTMKLIIREFENTLPLSRPGHEEGEIIRVVDRLKRERRIYTMPDVTGLISFGLWLGGIKKRDGMKLSEVFEEFPDLKNIGERYHQYMKWCIPIAAELADSPEEHNLVVEKFCRGSSIEYFIFEYINTMKNERADIHKGSEDRVSNYLFSYFYYILTRLIYSGEEELIQKTNDMLTQVLTDVPVRFLKKLDESLRGKFAERGLSVPVYWGNIYSGLLEQNGKSVYKKIKEMFRS